MRKFVVFFLFASFLFPLQAQMSAAEVTEIKDSSSVKNKKEIIFTTVKENPITSIKNQSRSGTCWAYSGLGFLESELLRLGKGEHELSRMFLVHHTYTDRGVNYVRFHGEAPFGQGGSFYDILYGIKHYGIVPETVYKGIEYGDSLPNFTELDKVMTSYIQSIGKSGLRKLSPVWLKGYEGVLNTYLGPLPEKFNYEGKEYTPLSYAESLGLDMDDYLSLTSYTHHPFYTQFALEIPDNWRGGMSYNLPLDELMETMDYAIKNGFTFAWGTDVSEAGFSRNGTALMTGSGKVPDTTGSDAARWLGEIPAETKNETEDKPLAIGITQEMRQEAFDNWETTDDHGMLVYGIAKDQYGHEYFMVKNSWGETGKYKGIWYANKPFVAYKTMNIVVHKEGIPKNIRKKLGIK